MMGVPKRVPKLRGVETGPETGFDRSSLFGVRWSSVCVPSVRARGIETLPRTRGPGYRNCMAVIRKFNGGGSRNTVPKLNGAGRVPKLGHGPGKGPYFRSRVRWEFGRWVPKLCLACGRGYGTCVAVVPTVRQFNQHQQPNWRSAGLAVAGSCASGGRGPTLECW